MKLVHFEIKSDFKNLKGLELDFAQACDTFALIGNNGTGKSNIIEAFSSVFRSIYDETFAFEFEFVLVYKLMDGKTVTISNVKAGKRYDMTVDKVPVPSEQTSVYLPNRIICNYSGEDERLNRLYYAELLERYQKTIIHSEENMFLRLILIEKNQWDILFLIMYACRGQFDAFNRFLSAVIGVRTIDRIHVGFDDDVYATWTETNATKLYADHIKKNLAEDSTIGIEELFVGEKEPRELYYQWIQLKAVIKDLVVSFNDGISIQMLSEGEKKEMVVTFILEALSDENSIVLLDEPDSHLHITKKEYLAKLLQAYNYRSNIITSHSPTLTSALSKDFQKSILMLRLNQNTRTVETVNAKRREAIRILTDGKWTLEQQNFVLSSNKDLVLVEGATDIPLLQNALDYFKSQGLYKDLDFQFIPCSGASGVNTMKDLFLPEDGQMVFAFVDNDNAGCSAIRDIFGIDEKNFKKSEWGKAHKANGKVWCSFYPIPEEKSNVSNFNVEDYIPAEKLKAIMLDAMSRLSVTQINLKSEVNNKINTFVGDDYIHFKAVFDLIQEIKQAEQDGKADI